MGSFKCICGHIIRDQRANLPYKGEIISDQAFEEFYGESVQQIDDFIHAIIAGKRDEWVNNFYQYREDDYKTMSNDDVISDILNRASVQHNRGIFQCESCGRIFIEMAPRSFRYQSFLPETGDWQGILAVKTYNTRDKTQKT